METIRCPRCNKLLRADAQSCIRCGVSITPGKVSKKRAGASAPSRPTSPPASPHRAGHYSGLHPEDQPFQSSFFVRVQRAPESAPIETDASTLLELDLAQSEDDAPQLPARPDLSPLEEDEDNSAEMSALADLPTLYPQHVPTMPIAETPLPALPRSSVHRIRVVPLLITGAVICFLVASSLLTFLLLSKNRPHAAEPGLIALPGELRVGDILQLSGSGFEAHHVVSLSRDGHTPLQDEQGRQALPTTDARGGFQVHIPITAAWSIGVHRLLASEGDFETSTSLTIQAAVSGPPRLQLGVSRIDLGAGNPGTLAQKNMTLANAGGGRVTWTAHSNSPWLSVSPASGSFAGNVVVMLTANRANLVPQAYQGQIVFTQDQGASQTLYVSMTVNTTPANLVLSTASLAFAGTPVQSPAGQTIVLQNSGGQTLNWTSGSTTTGSVNWLSVSPVSGTLDPNASASLTISVNSVGMALGSYQGALSFSYPGGPAQQVAVTLAVNPPPVPVMHLSTQNLSFSTKQGFDPPAQSFTISNSGNGPLNWTISADSTGQAYLTISPTRGTVQPGQSARVSIAPRTGSANGTLKSTLIVADSDSAGSTVPAQQVGISIAITNEPVITVSNTSLEFDHDSAYTDSSTLLVFTNSGSLPLNWAITQSAAASWLSFDTTSGTLAAGDGTYINVRCVSNQVRPGTYTVTLTLRDTDAGTVVAPRTITITLVVVA